MGLVVVVIHLRLLEATQVLNSTPEVAPSVWPRHMAEPEIVVGLLAEIVTPPGITRQLRVSVELVTPLAAETAAFPPPILARDLIKFAVELSSQAREHRLPRVDIQQHTASAKLSAHLLEHVPLLPLMTRHAIANAIIVVPAELSLLVARELSTLTEFSVLGLRAVEALFAKAYAFPLVPTSPTPT